MSIDNNFEEKVELKLGWKPCQQVCQLTSRAPNHLARSAHKHIYKQEWISLTNVFKVKVKVKSSKQA